LLAYILAPVVALATTVAVMWLLAPWLRRRAPPRPHRSPEPPTVKLSGWAFAISDEMSLLGYSIVFSRALIGSLAAVGLARLMCQVLGVPPHWPLAVSVGLLFILWDLFLLRHVSGFAIRPTNDTLRVLSLRQASARILGDALGTSFGLAL